MKSVAICSLMRAGSVYERAYYTQILGLSQRGFKIASVNVVYDAEPTESEWLRELLRGQGIAVHWEIEKVSAAHLRTFDDKIVQWAANGNQCLELALAYGDDVTHLAWIEADLSYPFDVLELLLSREKPIIAPLVYLGNLFYDSWGFRDRNGTKMTFFEACIPHATVEPIELNSVGSFVLFDAALFRAGIRFRGEYDHGLLVGLCEDAAKLGMKTYADPAVSVLHPVSAWRDQVWPCKLMHIYVDGSHQWDFTMPTSANFAGPYVDMVTPWVDQSLLPIIDSKRPTRDIKGSREISIVREGGERTFNLRVDIDSTAEKSHPSLQRPLKKRLKRRVKRFSSRLLSRLGR
jgi:hypothetical protein